MLQVKINEPLDLYIRAMSDLEGITKRDFVIRAVERELAEVAKSDRPGRVLRAHGWRAGKEATR